MEMAWESGAILNRVVRTGLTEKVSKNLRG